MACEDEKTRMDELKCRQNLIKFGGNMAKYLQYEKKKITKAIEGTKDPEGASALMELYKIYDKAEGSTVRKQAELEEQAIVTIIQKMVDAEIKKGSAETHAKIEKQVWESHPDLFERYIRAQRRSLE